MALLQLNYLSKTIGAHNSLNVILPEDESFFDTNREAKPLKSMLVLHGLSSDATSYIRYTSIERYANDHQLAIIMPNADHSFYTNMVYGHAIVITTIFWKCMTMSIKFYHYLRREKITL